MKGSKDARNYVSLPFNKKYIKIYSTVFLSQVNILDFIKQFRNNSREKKKEKVIDILFLNRQF